MDREEKIAEMRDRILQLKEIIIELIDKNSDPTNENLIARVGLIDDLTILLERVLGIVMLLSGSNGILSRSYILLKLNSLLYEPRDVLDFSKQSFYENILWTLTDLRVKK